MQILCNQCNKTIDRVAAEVKRHSHHFCSTECNAKFRSTLKISTCGYCSKSVSRHLRELNRSKSGLAFCNQSCSAKYSNKHRIRVYKWKCKLCNSPTSYRRVVCIACNQKLKEEAQLVTIADLKRKRNDAGRYSYIRFHARKILETIPKICQKCGYNKHVEVCHKKKIVDFPDETTTKEINDPSNILILCPNCHWEHDHQ